jgi:hypothetical protein
MKNAALLLAAALLAPAAAHAVPDTKAVDPMAAFYGNTVIISVPAGYYVAQRYIDPDGTWREPAAGVRGVWKIEAGQICSWQIEPAIVDVRHYCYPITVHKVGETWTTTDPATGNEVIQKIEAGRD